ncbi:hypothetical protein C1H46_044597 [Malus baccata]|uniref:Integrase catalytic domain-containing protein n=1 Tax=Malus baccata TaxID=106549 RepID=A0A540K6M5_MALBA|nr:hypothetical protein C1H46_044597 [Malus baccata]
MNLANIPILTGGSNYKKWRREIGLLLTLNEFDIALDIPKPVLTDQSTRAEKVDAERWVRANKVALSILESAMTDTVRGGIKKHDLAIDYLNAIERKFKESQKAEISHYMAMLTTYKIEGTGSIRDHIMKMTDAAEKLNSLDVNIGEKQLVFMILQALPSKFSQLKVSYNTQDKNWDVDELIAQCVQEENRQKQERGKEAEMVNFVQSDKGKKAFNSQSGHSGKNSHTKPTSFKSNASAKVKDSFKGSNNLKVKTKNIAKLRCFFCKTKGHLRKDCQVFQDYLKSKGVEQVNVCVESNLIEIPVNSWWFDTGCSVHITNSLEGFMTSKQTGFKNYNVFVGEGTKVAVEAIGIVCLKLSSGFVLRLNDVLFVPKMRRNLISASKIVKDGFGFLGDDECLKIFQKNHLDSVLGTAYLSDNLWCLNCTVESINQHVLNTSTKRMHCSDDSFILWHKRLGHISKERVLKLSRAKLIPELNFTTATDCVDCVKGKMTNFRKLDAKRCHDLLEIIHTDICGPFPTKTICGNSYFVNFIDDFSRFCYTYLLSEKSSVLDCFKIYKTEVEKQLGKTIKIVRSDRGGEYFGRYSEAGQCKGPFALFLEQQGIVAQYTTPGTPQQNGVSERRNRTLIGMVRSMMTRSKLPGFLWGEALKTATYILNRVPCKAVSSTPFEVWNGRKPSFDHFHIWGCKAEARIYNPHEKKLDSRTESCYFIGYSEKSKGFKFYCPQGRTRIQETNNARFFEDQDVADLSQGRFIFEEPDYEETSSSNDAYKEILITPSSEIELEEDQLAAPPTVDRMEVDFGTQIQMQGDHTSNSDVPMDSNTEVPHEPILPLRQSSRIRKPTMSNDYVYLQESEFDFGDVDDPLTYSQAMNSPQQSLWHIAMKEELESMSKNKVWTLVDYIYFSK